MGSTQCCLILEIDNYDRLLTEGNQKRPMLMARIFNTSVLQGDDFITFYDGDYQNLLVNDYNTSIK
jgi:hypothetical protein